MREADYPSFVALLDSTCNLLSRGQHTPSAMQAAMWFRSLAEFDIADVRAAFDAHIRDPQRGRFVPLPADILAQLHGAAADDTRPGAEEAWAIALRATDEAATVVWTEEIAQAWAVALPVLDARDQVGARMAFREAYDRLVTDARADRKPARWSASLGWDEQQRAQAIGHAVQLGYLPREELLALPAPRVTLAPPPEVRAKLLELRETIAARAESLTIDTSERDALAARKAQVQQQVDAYAAGDAA